MKRGTILLRKIGIELNKKDFEYDVHSLVKAFYRNELTMYYKEEPQTEGFDLLFVVTYEQEYIHIQITDNQNNQEKKCFLKRLPAIMKRTGSRPKMC